MKHKPWITAAFLILFTNVYADDAPQSVQQGAQDYDWQTCVAAKTSDCINSCSTSEDVDCDENCDAIAKDKCQSEGLTPPQ